MNTHEDEDEEVSTDENERIVRDIDAAVTELRDKGAAIPAYQQTIYDVYYLWLEAGSGASYEQYFRWASVEDIARVVLALHQVGLSDIASLTEDAINIAFPDGIPTSHEEKCDLTNWTREQEAKLESLFSIFERSNGRIINVLGFYATQHGELGEC